VPRKLTLLLAAIAMLVPVAAVGCGGGDNGSNGNGTLSTTDNLKVAQDRADIEEFCALAPVGKGDLYDRAFFSVVSAVDQLILIYKKDSGATFYEALKKRDIKMKSVMEEAEKKLNSCGKDGKRQAAKITQALQSG
jgi:hypothetical protein